MVSAWRTIDAHYWASIGGQWSQLEEWIDWPVPFSSNGDGTLTLIKENDPKDFSILKNIVTQKGARTMAYDSVNNRAYLVTVSFANTPPATTEQPKPRPEIISNIVEVLVISF